MRSSGSMLQTVQPGRPPAKVNTTVEAAIFLAAIEGDGQLRWLVLARAAVAGIGGEPVFVVDSEHTTVDGARAAVRLARLQLVIAPAQA